MSDVSPEDVEMLYRETVHAARRLTVEEKLRLGGELFDDSCRLLAQRIRARLPGTGDEAAAELVGACVRFWRRREGGL